MIRIARKFYFIIFFAYVFGGTHVSNGDHVNVLSISRMLELLKLENKLVECALQKCETVSDNALLKLFLVTLSHRGNQSEHEAEAFVSNILNGFPLIRRLHVDWDRWLHHFEGVCLDSFEVSNYRQKLPTDDDMEAASAAIIRIQETYSLRVEDMTDGLLRDQVYDEKLSAPDCYIIGHYVFESQKKYNEALKWFQVARLIYSTHHVELYEMLGYGQANIWLAISKTFYQLEKDDEALHAIYSALAFEPGAENLLQHKIDLEQFIAHEKLCRGEIPQNTVLHCRYNDTTTPFLKWAPLKLEEISLDPYIVLYHDVIYDTEIEALKHDALKMFLRGQVGMGKFVEERTSNTAHFTEKHSLFVERIHRRFVDISGFDFSDAHPLQIINYGIGGHYYNHYDFYDMQQNPDMCKMSGDRIAAILIFMSNVEQGGATVFANIRTAVQPQKGSAVFWYNLDNAGNVDNRMIHASCPVIFGSKWAGLKLAFERRQMFIKPCYKI